MPHWRNDESALLERLGGSDYLDRQFDRRK
jgi:hypothetical protein